MNSNNLIAHNDHRFVQVMNYPLCVKLWLWLYLLDQVSWFDTLLNWVSCFDILLNRVSQSDTLLDHMSGFDTNYLGVDPIRGPLLKMLWWEW